MGRVGLGLARAKGRLQRKRCCVDEGAEGEEKLQSVAEPEPEPEPAPEPALLALIPAMAIVMVMAMVMRARTGSTTVPKLGQQKQATREPPSQKATA